MNAFRNPRYLPQTITLAFLLLLSAASPATAQMQPQDVVFGSLNGYWAGTLEQRSAGGDTTTIPTALQIRRSFDGNFLTLSRSARVDGLVIERVEIMQFDPDSLLLRSVTAEGDDLRQHRYALQGLPRVHSPRRWVIRRTEKDSLRFSRITDIMQHDSLIVLKQFSSDGLNWNTEELMRLARRQPPQQAVFFLPGFPDAHIVSVVGDFNGWTPGRTTLQRVRDGWRTEVTLPPGEYQYKFWVDGTLVRDLLTSSVITDGKGGYNALLTIR